MPGYPTKEEILREPRPKHRRDVLALTRNWKHTGWQAARADRPDTRETMKRIQLTGIICEIANVYGQPISVSWSPGYNNGHYDPVTRMIHLVGAPSIITVLHELGHHLFGGSERRACRWSIWLFRKTFPLAYAGLVWRGHLLVRPTPMREEIVP
jgi:hypothetical protein